MKKLICALFILGLVSPAFAKGKVDRRAEQKRIEVAFNKKYNQYIDYIYEASMKTGMNMSEIAAFLKIESGFNPNAYNPKFGAAGLFQHIPSTWKLQSKLYGKQMGIKPGTDVYNPKASIYVGAAALSAERKKLANDINRDVITIKTGELYLTHAYGYSKAVRILTAPANDKITKYVMLNPKSGMDFYKDGRIRTVAEFVEGVNLKLEKDKAMFARTTIAYQKDKFLDNLYTFKATLLAKAN